MTFKDRIEAGQKLGHALGAYATQAPIVYGLPRGGVAVAAEIARALKAPLELVLVRKVGVPWQPELAMGAIVDGETPVVVTNEDVLSMARVSSDEFNAACTRELAEIARRRQRYLGGRAPLSPHQRTAIVVDDGIATGATIRAALRALRLGKPRKLVLAVPVAPRDTLESLKSEADETVCLETPDDLGAIGYFYRDFRQLNDEDVVRILSGFTSISP